MKYAAEIGGYMESAVFSADKVRKEFVFDGSRIVSAGYVCDGGYVEVAEEFEIVWRENPKGKKRVLRAGDCNVSPVGNGLCFTYGDFTVVEKFAPRQCGVLEKRLTLIAPDRIFVEKIYAEKIKAERRRPRRSAPLAGRTFVSAKVARLGQPVYADTFFFGQETPVGDNGIRRGTATFCYHTGRLFADVAENGEYSLPPFIAGAAGSCEKTALREAFFEYLDTVIRKPVFRIQYNSWYDNKLDITSERIEKSFSAIARGFAEAGMGPLDCYVVDDGWTEYEKPSFWQFNSKFEQGFEKEAALTKKLGSKFGVWFGPRGGYTSQTYRYAKLLESIGYHVNEKSKDVCTADSRYIAALCDRMADFCKLYNADYFKIDGFACAPCKAEGHNHPAAKGDSLAFYTFLWEEWIKGFEKIRRVKPDVCLNITSYAHCSPWFLMWVDYVWMNNASDMDFTGHGSDMQRCLNYRDGRYRDLFVVRQYDFPAGHLYNHEPTYARKNYKSLADRAADKPVTYTDEEFSLYVKCCLARGSGLAELYFSPEMMNAKKWKAAAQALAFAKKHSDVMSRAEFLGGRPEKGEVYGYFAHKDGKYRLMLRNAGNKSRSYLFDLPVLGRISGELAAQQIIFKDNFDD